MAFSTAGLQLPVPTVIFVFEWQLFCVAQFFRNLAHGQVLDSGNNKRWKNFFFFEGHFWKIFLFPSCDRIIFYSFFPCSIAKILVVLQAFETLEAPSPPPFGSTFLFWQNTFLFHVLKKSTLPIFNVSRLGQLSDLFLLLFFPPYHCWNIDVMQCLLQFAALLWFFFVTAAFSATAFGQDFNRGWRGSL